MLIRPSNLQRWIGIQSQLYDAKKSAMPKTEEQVVGELILSKNATAKDKKLKEMLQKNRDLNLQYEKERTLYALPHLCND